MTFSDISMPTCGFKGVRLPLTSHKQTKGHALKSQKPHKTCWRFHNPWSFDANPSSKKLCIPIIKSLSTTRAQFTDDFLICQFFTETAIQVPLKNYHQSIQIPQDSHKKPCKETSLSYHEVEIEWWIFKVLPITKTKTIKHIVIWANYNSPNKFGYIGIIPLFTTIPGSVPSLLAPVSRKYRKIEPWPYCAARMAAVQPSCDGRRVVEAWRL